nr:MAG TPA: hypothetical protein [Caudoviricetes sp.]
MTEKSLKSCSEASKNAICSEANKKTPTRFMV